MPPTESLRKRWLSPLNRAFCLFDRMMTANGCEWFEITGRVDLDLVRQAALTVAGRHPVLNARLDFDPWHGPYWTEGAPNAPIDIRVETVAAAHVDDINDRLVKNIYGEHLPLGEGRPFRIHVTELRDITVLQIITTHIYTDGPAGYLFGRDFVRAYNALEAGAPWQPERVDVEDRDHRTLFWNRQANGDRWRLALHALHCILRDLIEPAVKVGYARGERGATGVIMTDFGPELRTATKSLSEKLGVSRHPLYLAAAVRAVEDYNARRGIPKTHSLVKIIDNFSLRPFNPEATAELYDVCSTPYSLRADSALEDLDLIRDVSRQIERLRRGEILAEIFRYTFYAAALKFIPKAIAMRFVTSCLMKSNIVMSNLGNVSDEIQSFGKSAIHNYYSFNQLFPPGQIMFVVSVRNDRLRLVTLFDSGNFKREEVEAELVQGFRHHLTELSRKPLPAEPAAPPSLPIADRA